MKTYYRALLSLGLMILCIIIGVIGFQYFENLNFFESLWLTVISVLTIGYGDTVPLTTEGKYFALFIIPLGIGIVGYTLSAMVSSFVEGNLSEGVRRGKMEKKIKKLEDHIIVCGYGRVGQQIVKVLKREKTPHVIIDINPEHFTESIKENNSYIIGNATEDDILISAGIEKAQGIVATLPDDADNVLITLTSRGLNPNIQISTRAEKTETEEKLIRAGANTVINPSSIGGRRLALSIVKPSSLDLVDKLMDTSEDNFQIKEFLIDESSILCGKKIAELEIRKNYGVTILAIHSNGEIIPNPSADHILIENSTTVIVGSTLQLSEFEKIFFS